MFSRDRLQVFPTQMNKNIIQTRLRGAERSEAILKKKADLIEIRLRKVSIAIAENKNLMDNVLKDASFMFVEAKLATGGFSETVLGNVGVAHRKVRLVKENLAGIILPEFQCYEDGVNEYRFTGLARGGQPVHKLQKKYVEAIQILVKLAGQQIAFVALDEAMRITNRKRNAVKRFIIPRLENTLVYIQLELEEAERENVHRMKKIRDNKFKLKQEKCLPKESNKNRVEPRNLLDEYEDGILF